MHSPTLPPLNAAGLQGLVTAHSRAPRQRSRPTSEASLGLGLTSALSGDRSVGLAVARHLVWGRGCRARSRRLCRCTGTAPAADQLGLICWPDSLGEASLRREQFDALRRPFLWALAECLNASWFLSMHDARDRIESWRHDDHTARPHSALGNLTPRAFARQAHEARTVA